MNDPLQFTGATPVSAITQSVTRVGSLLPDKDFSEQKHEEISKQAFECFMNSGDDIGMTEEAMHDGEAVTIIPQAMRPRELMENQLAGRPQGNLGAAKKLLAMQIEQEKSLRREGRGPDFEYVRDRDYGSPDPVLSEAAQAELIEKVKEHAKKHGVDL